MNRRTLIKTGSLALAGFGLSGCATGRAAGPAAAPAVAIPRAAAQRQAINLACVRAAWERVIRTTVGLRPHRDSGFVLKAVKFDDKTIVHNYGHGGAGMSLAWGMGAMAGDMALEVGDRRAAVLGCGSPGLTAARQLQRRGFDVTIYAMSVPPHTTSNMSMAGFTPTAGLVEEDKRTPAWDAQFRQAADLSYRQLQLLAGTPGYGVYWMDSYNATDELPQQPAQANASTLLPAHLQPNRHREILGPGEHPFPTKYAIRTAALSIEPSIYLEALMRDFALFGGKIVIRKFDTPRDLMTLTQPIIVNSTGLGSKTLFDDEELVPIKGQLTALIPQPEVNYRLNSRLVNGMQVGMNPRSDGIVLGNLQERGNWSLEPDEQVRQRAVEGAMAFFDAMQAAAPGAQIARSRAPRDVPSVESFYGLES